MIYLHTHAHYWVPTQGSIHGSPIERCTICGDVAYREAEE